MTRWETLEHLANQRFTQTSTLAQLRDRMATISLSVSQAADCLPLDRFSSVDELKDAIAMLKVRTCGDLFLSI